jgi:hypothetical protein
MLGFQVVKLLHHRGQPFFRHNSKLLFISDTKIQLIFDLKQATPVFHPPSPHQEKFQALKTFAGFYGHKKTGRPSSHKRKAPTIKSLISQKSFQKQ